MLELVLAVEMILDHALVAAGDEDEMLDAGLARLVHHMLDQRPVDHRQHFLGHGLGRGQEAGAKPRHGEHGLADASSHFGSSLWLSVRQQGDVQPGLEVLNLYPIASRELQMAAC